MTRLRIMRSLDDFAFGCYVGLKVGIKLFAISMALIVLILAFNQ